MPRFVFSVILLLCAAAIVEAKPVKVLFVTQMPGRYHDYNDQTRILLSELPKYGSMEFTIMAGTANEVLAKMGKPGYTKGYDVVLYNMCHAKTDDSALVRNVIDETAVRGTPAVLVHCAMHCFWPTSSAKNPKLTAAAANYQKLNPQGQFPYWWKFVGLHTVRHERRRDMTIHKASPEHNVVKALPKTIVAPNDELYVNIELVKGVQPILVCKSADGKKDHVVAWHHKVNGASVFGTTIGHGMETFGVKEFHQLVANGVLFAADKLGDDGKPAKGYEGNANHRLPKKFDEYLKNAPRRGGRKK